MPDTSGQPGGEVGAAGLDYIAEPLRSLAVPIAELNADPANARRHPGRNMEAIEASLRRWGQRFPIVVQRQGMVVRAGNGRLEAARRLGWTHLAAVVVDEDSVEATAFALADNRSSELAEWDDEALAALLESVPKDMPTGFSEADMEALLAGLNAQPVEPPELNSGDKSAFVQVTFVVTEAQRETINAALSAAKSAAPFVDTGNENSNGNALERISEAYLG